jgi:thymidylate kinase
MDHPDEWRDPAQPDALVFQALQTVNRLELLPQIMEALTRGPVVFDRYTASGLVYGGLDGLDPKWIELVNASLPEPDLWILLDAPVAVGFERRPERRDRIESNREYLEKVRTGYLELFNSKQMKQIEEGVHVDNFSWRMVSAIGTIDEVAARIWDVTSKRISPSPGRAA